LAYAIILPALYPPMIAMLLALIFRGVAFEFRWRDPRHRHAWDLAFTGGSFLAAFAQGIILGAILQGISVTGRAYSGGWLDWLTPFTLLTGASTVIAYGLLGATWLVWRTEGGIQAHAWRLSRILGIATLAAIIAVSLATPFLDATYYRRWFTMPWVLMSAQVPLLVGIAALLFWRALKRRQDAAPFAIALFIFLLCFAGLGVSMFPYVVPDAVTIWDAAAPERSQVFMLIGAGIMVPIILIYTGFSYWVFRGKVGHDGYH